NKAAKDKEYDLIDKLSKKLPEKTLVVVTVHRRENHGENIASVANAVFKLLEKHKDLIIVWPVHPNPKVKDTVYSAFFNASSEVKDRLYLTEPLNYPILLWLLKNCWLVLTDSGGIQEEAVALNKPILVLRETTERQEIIDAGAGILVGTDCKDIISNFEELSKNIEKYELMCNVINPFGDGTTSKAICDILIK
ncbi:MAG: UDP-N-acetylglucosamine 2-epimerase, partial [Pseudomonadota bacterium]